jgi:hypothetical protein
MPPSHTRAGVEARFAAPFRRRAFQILDVIPAPAGIHLRAATAALEKKMDSRLRGNDGVVLARLVP